MPPRFVVLGMSLSFLCAHLLLTERLCLSYNNWSAEAQDTSPQLLIVSRVGIGELCEHNFENNGIRNKMLAQLDLFVVYNYNAS